MTRLTPYPQCRLLASAMCAILVSGCIGVSSPGPRFVTAVDWEDWNDRVLELGGHQGVDEAPFRRGQEVHFAAWITGAGPSAVVAKLRNPQRTIVQSHKLQVDPAPERASGQWVFVSWPASRLVEHSGPGCWSVEWHIDDICIGESAAIVLR